MEPDKLSANVGTPESSLETANEVTPAALLKKLQTLIKTHKFVDEQHAKQLRKSWESLKLGVGPEDGTLVELEQGFETLRERIHKQVETRNTQFTEVERDLLKLKDSLRSDDLKMRRTWKNRLSTVLTVFGACPVSVGKKLLENLKRCSQRSKN